MKFTKYILFLLVTIFAVSCTIEDPTKGNGRFQIVSRIVPFDEHDVQTRAVAEDALNSLDYFIFADISENGTPIWACVFYKHAENDIIAIDRSIDFAALAANDPGLTKLAKCRIVLVANYPGIQSQLATDAGTTDLLTYINDKVLYTSTNDTEYKTADYFQSITTPVEPLVGIPETGFPRVGDFGTIVNLSDAGGDDIQAGKTYTVNLKSLYAKMVFDIKVEPTQGNVITGEDEDGNDIYADGNKFLFEGYDVYNLPTTVDMIPGRESGKGLADGTNDSTLVNKIEDANPAAVRVYKRVIEGDLTGLTTAPRKTVFTCYLPERYLTAKVAANEYNYPFSSSGADAARDEDEKLLQRYKPEIAQPNATFVRFYGTFYNHQGHSFNVSYDIYVGNDNYGNFDVVRNRQYNNIITIRGIDNSSDQSNNDQAVSIDHRVNVSRTSPIIINLRRETMLDSHFEVRPLRIRANMKDNRFEKGIPANTAVKVEISRKDETGAKGNWIGLERSYGNGSNNSLYCDGEGDYGPSSAGKRKYFTTNLTISELAGANGQTVIVPVTEAGECVWIYVDECDEEAEASTDLQAIRSAEITVTYGTLNGSVFLEDNSVQPVKYVINQHLLYKIQSSNDLDGNASTTDYYYIEHEEEYLYNFDAEDNYEYNQTQFEGMQWGLPGAQLSYEHRAIYVKGVGLLGSTFEGILQWIIGFLSPYYDFYLDGDSDKDVTTHNITDGYDDFCPKIVSRAGIGVLALDDKPESAVEYCYNRNKRNADGQVVSANWYLPNILEIQEIVTKAYIQFDDFQNKYYWSSQPAYMRNYYFYNYGGAKAHGEYMIENVNYARATKYNYSEDKYYPNGMTGYNVVREQTSLDDNGYTDYPAPYTIRFWTLTGGNQQIPISPAATFDEGYKHRTNEEDWCRVRAVRKMN